MLAEIEKINMVQGFNPAPFAVDYTDLNNGEGRKRLPVMIQMAWFRLKYPEGKIAVQVAPVKDCFVATARIYPCFKDPAECYLAEATASRGPDPSKPSVSPREWAQTAAVGIALRNAGFGLQFGAAGEDFEGNAADELGATLAGTPPADEADLPDSTEPTPVGELQQLDPETRELTPEEKLQQAMLVPCPITKYNGKTLGDLLALDPKALNWVATKFTGGTEISGAAKIICEYALQQATA
jgi:hypothetical protein